MCMRYISIVIHFSTLTAAYIIEVVHDETNRVEFRIILGVIIQHSTT